MIMYLTNFMIGASVLFALALLCTKVFKNLTSSSRCGIWMLYLLSLPLITITIFTGSNKVSVIKVPNTLISYNIERLNVREQDSDRKYSNQLPVMENADKNPKILISTERESIAENTLIIGHTMPLPIIFSLIWMTGMLLLFLRLLSFIFISSRISNKATPYFDFQLSKNITLKTITIYTSRQVNIPGVYGIFNTRIVLPEEAFNWGENEIKFVCLHEYGHIVNRHVVLNIFASILRAIYWFVPFSWIVYIKMRFEQENTSDDFIIKSGHNNLSYAHCLLSISKKLPNSLPKLSPTPSMISHSQMSRRIKRIIAYKQGHDSKRIASFSMSLTLFICCLVLVSTIQCFSTPNQSNSENIEFKDINLERAILGRSAFEWEEIVDINKIDINKDGRISKEEALKVKSLKLINQNITNLHDLEYFENLEILHFKQDQFTDLSPISTLENLRELTIGFEGLTNISKLGTLPNLEYLQLEGNSLTDISLVSDLPGLIYLGLFANKVEDIRPIKNLVNLRILELDYNEIKDISSLAGLYNLEELWINHNQIENIDPLISLSKLHTLIASENKIRNITVLTKLRALKRISIWDNPIIDNSPLELLEGVEIEEKED